jgi:hypothetical protein
MALRGSAIENLVARFLGQCTLYRYPSKKLVDIEILLSALPFLKRDEAAM